LKANNLSSANIKVQLLAAERYESQRAFPSSSCRRPFSGSERDDDFDAPATPARTLSFIFSAMMSKYFENAPFPQRQSSQKSANPPRVLTLKPVISSF
jgi:hypothetical protein